MIKEKEKTISRGTLFVRDLGRRLVVGVVWRSGGKKCTEEVREVREGEGGGREGRKGKEGDSSHDLNQKFGSQESLQHLIPHVFCVLDTFLRPAPPYPALPRLSHLLLAP